MASLTIIQNVPSGEDIIMIENSMERKFAKFW